MTSTMIVGALVATTLTAATAARAADSPGLRLVSSGVATDRMQVGLTDGTVLFGASEPGEGRDLNGDGDAVDIVAATFDPTRNITNFLGAALLPRSVSSMPSPVALDGGRAALLVDAAAGESDVALLATFAAGQLTVTDTEVGPGGITALDAYRVVVDVEVSPLGSGVGIVDVRTGTLTLVSVDQPTAQVTDLELRESGFSIVPGGGFAFLVDEGRTGEDRNGDGDDTDRVGVVVTPDGEVHDLGVAAASLVGGRDGHVAVTVSEVGEGRDIDGDGDTQDIVVHVWDPADGSLTATAATTQMMGSLGGAVDVVHPLGGGFAVASSNGESPVKETELVAVGVDGSVLPTGLATYGHWAVPLPGGDLYVEDASATRVEAVLLDGDALEVVRSGARVMRPGQAAVVGAAADGSVAFATEGTGTLPPTVVALFSADGTVAVTGTTIPTWFHAPVTPLGDGLVAALAFAGDVQLGNVVSPTFGPGVVDVRSGSEVVLPDTANVPLRGLTPLPGVGLVVAVAEAGHTDVGAVSPSDQPVRIDRNGDGDTNDRVLAVAVIDDTPDVRAPMTAPPMLYRSFAADVVVAGRPFTVSSVVDDRGLGDRVVRASFELDGALTAFEQLDGGGSEARERVVAEVVATTVGRHEACVVGADAAGNESMSCADLWVDDGSAPAIIVSRDASAMVGEPHAISVELTDATRVFDPVMTIDGQRVGAIVAGGDGQGIVTLEHTVTFDAPGLHTLCVSATDRLFGATECEKLPVDDGSVPVLDEVRASPGKALFPSTVFRLGESVEVSSTFTDEGLVAAVEHTVDGVVVALDDAPERLNTGRLARSLHRLVFERGGVVELCAVGIDAAGNRSTPSCQRLRVDGGAPTIDLLELPAAPVSTDEDLVVRVTATDDVRVAGGTVTVAGVTLPLIDVDAEHEALTQVLEARFLAGTVRAGDHEVCVSVRDSLAATSVACGGISVVDGAGPLVALTNDPGRDVEFLYPGDAVIDAGRYAGLVSDSESGGSRIAEAVLTVDGVPTPIIAPIDGVYDQAVELLEFTDDLRFATPGLHTVCLSATDEHGNLSTEPSCRVFDVVPYVLSGTAAVTGVTTPVGSVGPVGQFGRGSFTFEISTDGAAVGEPGSGRLRYSNGLQTFEATSIDAVDIYLYGAATVSGMGTVNGVEDCPFVLSLQDERGGKGEYYSLDLRGCSLVGATTFRNVAAPDDIVVPIRNLFIGPR